MNYQTLRWMLLLAVLASQASNAAVPIVPTGREYAETVLLLSGKEVDMRFGIKSLYKQDAIRPSSLDLLAEIAWSACSGKRKIDSDTLAWLAKTIGKSRQGRYATLINDCLAKARENAKGKDTSLVRYLTEAQAALADSPSANSFAGGSLSIDEIREDLLKNRKPVPAGPLAKELYGNLKSGQKIDDVYARLGAPESITAMSEIRGSSGFGPVKIRLSDDRILFRYPGLGEVRFGYDEPAGNWLLTSASSNYGQHWLAKDGRFVTINTAISEGDREDLTKITKLLKKQKEPIDIGTLDRIADRIYFSQKEVDGGLTDTLAHMCKLLGNSGNGKYKQLLREVSEKAAHSTLRKYAAQAADSLPDTNEPMYVAGRSLI